MTQEQKEKLLKLIERMADSHDTKSEERKEWNTIYWQAVRIETKEE